MIYQYLGIGRLQLWLASPNVCATWLVMTILLSIGVFLVCRDRKNWWGYTLAGFAAGGIVLQQLMLAATYSRGGYVAFAAGILLLWYLVRRRAAWVFGLTGLAAILLVANGVERVASIAKVASDASIGNRFLLWRGAAGIIRAHWFAGVETPGELYHAWYQPLWLDEIYRTMINDFLTLGANHGVGVMFLYLALFFAVIWGGILFARAGMRAPWLGAPVAAVAGYFVAATFSTMYEHDDIFYFIVPLVVLTGGIELALVLWRRVHWRWRPVLVPVGLAAGISIAVLAFGAWVNTTLPYAQYREASQTVGSESYRTRWVTPYGPLRGSVICLLSKGDTEVIRTTVRPLLELGYRVIAAEVDSGLDGVEHGRQTVRAALAEPTIAPVWLVGEGDGGKAALLIAPEMPSGSIAGIAAGDAPAEWPFAGLAPIEVIDRYSGPVLLTVTEQAADELHDAAARMAELRRKQQLPVTQITLPASESGKTAPTWFAPVTAWMAELEAKERAGRLEVVVFHRSGCRHCEQLAQAIRALPPDVAARIRVTQYDVMTPEGRTRYEAYRQHEDIAGDAMETPGVFFGTEALIGEAAPGAFAIRVAAATGNPTPTWEPGPEELQEAEHRMLARFRTISAVAIAIAGLIDGINPCVFSALVFFISLLTVARVSSRQLLTVGLVYAAAYYVTYFAMGLGLVALWDFLNGLQWVGRALTYGMAGVLVILAALSIRDALRFKRTGSAGVVTLQLPDALKKRIRALMRRGLHYRYLIPGTFAIGVCVTLIESACTAQVYIPTAGVLAQYGAWSARVLWLLALYNLMCIVPLLLIFALAYHGVTGRIWLRWSRTDVVWGKWAMGLLFLGLAVLLLFGR